MNPQDMPLGIDVASHQHPFSKPIDWNAVAGADIKFAFIKATEGVEYRNPFFKDDWIGAKNAGVIRGAYHWAKPGVNDARAEANYFYDAIEYAGGLEPGDLIALDVEEGAGNNYGGWFLYWLQIMESYVGFKPILYTGKWYLDQSDVDDMPGIETYPLWYASYQSTMPPSPRPWPFISIWQFSDKGQIPGISSNVDLNRFNSTIDRLPLLGKPQKNTPTPNGIGVSDLDSLYEQLNNIERSAAALRLSLETLRSKLVS